MPYHENGDSDGGIPTRAIHEAYLDMERALKAYRQAKDTGDGALIDDAHGEVQETLLTFYDLLRPHIKHNQSVKSYWDGELPRYNGNTEPPDPEDGKGVIQVQSHVHTASYDELAFEAANADIDSIKELREVKSLKNWHHMLRLNGNQRVRSVRLTNDGVVASVDKYELGLRALDSWETNWHTTQTSLEGFLGGVQTQQTERQRVNIGRLKRAARELSDAAKEMGFLPQETPQPNDDALPI